METSIVNLAGTSVDGTRASLLPTFVGGLRPRAYRAVAGDALGGRGFGFGVTGITASPTTDPTVLDVTSVPTS